MTAGSGMADSPSAAAQPRPFDHNLSQRLENLPNMVMGVQSPEPTVQLEFMTQFRKVLSIERNPPIQQLPNMVMGVQCPVAWARYAA